MRHYFIYCEGPNTPSPNHEQDPATIRRVGGVRKEKQFRNFWNRVALGQVSALCHRAGGFRASGSDTAAMLGHAICNAGARLGFDSHSRSTRLCLSWDKTAAVLPNHRHSNPTLDIHQHRQQ